MTRTHSHIGGCVASHIPIIRYAQNALQQSGQDPQQLFRLILAERSERPQAPPTIFHNGVIRTMASRDPNATAEAIAIRGHDIVAVGSLDQCEEELRGDRPNVNRVDLEGKCMLPGLIEPHVHVLPTALFATWVDVSPFKGQKLVGEEYSMEWCFKRIKHAMGDYVKGGWVMAFGMDPSLFHHDPRTEWQDPTADTIDNAVTKDLCVFILNASGHVAYANSKGLKESGSDNPNKNGVLLEVSQILPVFECALRAQIKESPLDFFRAVLENILKQTEEATTRGVTLMWDAALEEALSLPLLHQVVGTGRNIVRLGGAVVVHDLDKMPSFSPTTYDDPSFKVPCVKIVNDGSNQGQTGFQNHVYPNPDPNINKEYPMGVFNFNPDDTTELNELVKEADAAGWSLMIHANGAAAIDRTLDAYRHARDSNGTDTRERRHRIEHCSLLCDESLDAMKELSLSPSFLIGHVGYWGYAFQQKVFAVKTAYASDPRSKDIDLTRGAVSRGMRISLHSDHFVSPLGPLRMVEQAVTRAMEDDPEHGVLNAKECLTVGEALRAVTCDAAWQCWMDELCGSLESGKRADFVLLEKDPMDVGDAAGLRDFTVCETWMDGRRTYTNATSV